MQNKVIGFLDFEGGIKGGSKDAKHQGWIELYAFHQCATEASSLAPNEIINFVEIEKPIDISTPEICLALQQGNVFSKATIDLVKYTPDGVDVFW